MSALVGLFPVALVLGVLTLRRTRSRGTRGRGLALAALVLGAVELVVAVPALVVALLAARSLQPLPVDLAAPRQAHARQLVVGSCLGQLPNDGVVDLVTVVPCDQSHVAQVVSTTQLSGSWPGQRAVDGAVADTCRLTQAQVQAGDRLVTWAPTRSGWRQGDRTGLCLRVDG